MGYLFACVLCNDSVLQHSDNQWQIIGDPTRGRVVLAQKAAVDRAANQQQFPSVAWVPFDSDSQAVSVICSNQWLFPLYQRFAEIILERCKYVQIGNDAIELTDSQRQQILDRNNQMASWWLAGIRFCFLTNHRCDPKEDEADIYERDLIWLGLVGMLDAARPEVKEAVN